MAQKKERIPRSTSELVEAFEQHLFMLWEALDYYGDGQTFRYKQVATELRVLVCERSGGASALLRDLMEEFGFTSEVRPPGRAGVWAIPMVREMRTLERRARAPQVNEQQAQRPDIAEWLAQSLTAFFPARDPVAAPVEAASNVAESTAPRDGEAVRLRAVPFAEYADNGLAVFIRPYEYSHCDLVRALAEQTGSSHESRLVDEPIVRMRGLEFFGDPAAPGALMAFAETVRSVGAEFWPSSLRTAATSLDFFTGLSSRRMKVTKGSDSGALLRRLRVAGRSGRELIAPAWPPGRAAIAGKP